MELVYYREDQDMFYIVHENTYTLNLESYLDSWVINKQPDFKGWNNCDYVKKKISEWVYLGEL
jgi:hypothetical protein